MITKTGSEVLEKKAFLGTLAKGFGSLGKRALPNVFKPKAISPTFTTAKPKLFTPSIAKPTMQKIKNAAFPKGYKEILKDAGNPFNMFFGGLSVASGMTSLGGLAGGMAGGTIGANLGRSLVTKVAPNSKFLQGVGSLAGGIGGWTVAERAMNKIAPVYKRELPELNTDTQYQ